MRMITYNNRTCLDLKDNDGKVSPFTLLIVADSGTGKGTSTESIAERWKRATGGVVILLNDEKKEGEQTFVMYEPEVNYHLNSLKKDMIVKNKYKANLYHPYTHNLAKKGILPDINFFTLSIKDMTRDDWSILAESDAESETIKLLERVAEDLGRNDSLFDFLHEIEKLTEGKKDKKKSVPDPKNWFLKSGGGTSKSVKQVGNMLSSFKKDYFIRKDTCPFKLDWEKILLNPEPYHIFLTNWIKNPKVKNFLVEILLGQAVTESQRLADIGKLKKPILFLIPELLKVCPAENKGSSYYLAKALRKSLVTMRSQGAGMSCIADTQNWSQTAPEVRGAFNNTMYGKLNPEDARIIMKSNSYNSTIRDTFKEIGDNKGCFVWYRHEDSGVISCFMPSHRHKEVGADKNWIQTYKKHYKDKMKSYNSLVNQMKAEYLEEYKITEKNVNKLAMLEIEESKKKEPENKTEAKESKKTIESKAKDYLRKRAFELHQDGLSDRKIAVEIGVGSHKTVKKYYLDYEKKLKEIEEEENNPDSVKNNIGDGVMPEEVEMNFVDTPTSEK